ncbi:MAG: hypothetical protein BWY37_01164 [Firmicutes bacterium ADurb.Bin262]|nr:MAG: hypothetical protein BWY37_01164 [Firmicutes bacterium ADurb.Bin262]
MTAQHLEFLVGEQTPSLPTAMSVVLDDQRMVLFVASAGVTTAWSDALAFL